MTARRLLLIAIGLGLIALTWWVIENMTWEEVRVPSQPKGEAVLNPLFAAQRLLTELGADAKSSPSFREPPTGDLARTALILPTQRRTLSPVQHDALEAWVRSGGHLIAVAHTLNEPGERADPLMETLGVKRIQLKPRRSRKPASPQTAPAAAPDPAPADPASPAGDTQAKKSDGDVIDRIEEAPEDAADMLPDDVPGPMPAWLPKSNVPCPEQRDVAGSEPVRFPAQALRICFSGFYHLTSHDPPLWSVKGRRGTQAIALPLGQGRVTVLTEWRFLRNDEIGRNDHADFLVALLGPDLKGMSVWLVPSEDVPGLHKLVWQHGAAVVATLAVLLLVVLWRAGTRLGPVAARVDPVRRSLLEHVRAMGEFIWREQDAGALWKSAVARTRKQMARVLPPTKNPDVMIQALAKKSALPEALIRESLFPQPHPDPDRFARAIATLEKLRKSL
ncbi:MAG: DUF4350 domain-containing protein [Burkholderiales bacterium]|nr:DUF4350 domain-containing protein [Burkholderiales bacterium]